MVYPSSDRSTARQSPPFALVVNATMKIADFEEACNGVLYVLDAI